MTGQRLRQLGLGVLASAGLLALPSTMNLAAASADAEDIGFVMGGSGDPIPGTAYVDAVNALYIASHFPDATYPGVLAGGLYTPELVWPANPLDASVAEGVTILNNNIDANIAAGDVSTVFGYSQSTLISSLEMESLQAAGVPSSDVNFVLVGDLMAPNGGIFARFPGQVFPSLDITFFGGAPTDYFTTDIYTLEYDGFADFPQYPIFFLSDANALMGMLTVHGEYPALPSTDVSNAIVLPTSGPTTDTFYMIPTQNLPLLDPVRSIPLIGNPVADLLQPDMKVLVDLGYGSVTEGWSQGPANVETPYGLLPPRSVLEQVPGALASGTHEGIENFVGDFTGTGPHPVVLPSFGSLQGLSSGPTGTSADPSSALSALTVDADTLIDHLVGTSNTFSALEGLLSSDLSVTANIADAVFVTTPTYDIEVFADNLLAGNLVDAVGLPIAADVAGATLWGGIELDVIVTSISDAIAILAP